MKEKEPTYVIKFNVKSLSTNIWYLLFIIVLFKLPNLFTQALYLAETENLPYHQKRQFFSYSWHLKEFSSA